MIKNLLALTVLATAGLAAPTLAATTLLDFSGNICGPAGNQACFAGSQIGANYGDSASVDVSYRSIFVATGATSEPFLRYWNSGYGNLLGVVHDGGGNSVVYRSEIIFTPLAGFEVALRSVDAGCFANRAECQIFNYNIRSVGGTAIAVGSTPTLFPLHATLAVNSGYFSDGIVLGWTQSNSTGLDNIVFDVRAVAVPPGGIPESASWAMMIAGFGLTGAAMRGRRSRRVVAA